ncbi:hypothetical protein CC117_23505 [Parafrankia colletiae]|uniref:Carrier domain-containing protein n=1 Tax=Parafrankia colletiae TaxID=573497 RepID=A0A1S1QHL3_9ACTN|nr:acyl carrier protein [Parafrankia colletiae]MCK9902332.1 acyl carrier protein [Frankia sp. Cpl3]OHV33147.1 hypothetical protein CC117_23505 [Parafrankia colletiae]
MSISAQHTETIERIGELPRSERFDALEELVVAEFRRTLLMTDDEELETEKSYFEMGFTSLRIIEIKQRLEELLGCDISANVLFNRPTVGRLISHLSEDVLADLFVGPGGGSSGRQVSGPAPQDKETAL